MSKNALDAKLEGEVVDCAYRLVRFLTTSGSEHTDIFVKYIGEYVDAKMHLYLKRVFEQNGHVVTK